MKKLLPLIFFILALIIPSTVEGQTELSTTVIPPRLELEALPGATLQETLKVRNETDTDMIYEAGVYDFIVNNNQGTPQAVDETVSGRWSLADWVTVSPKQLLVPARQTAGIDMIITIPPNGLPGGHYAMVVYTPILDKEKAGTATKIDPRVGSLVYLKVVGDVTEAANLKEFQVGAKFAHYGPVELKAEIENLGDIHVRPTGQISVKNWLGDEIYIQPLEEKNIFPFASRTYEWTVPGRWRLGRYTAQLTAQAGTTAIPLRGLIYFWIVPVKEVILISSALILLILLIILKTRRPKPNPDAPSPEIPNLS